MKTSDKNKPSLFWVLLSLSVIVVFGLFCIIGSGGGGGGGGGSDDGGTETTGAGSDIIELKAVMGPIIDATVTVTPLNDTSNTITTGITRDDNDINNAGYVSLTIPAGYSNTPLYIKVEGGFDIDVDDDGIRDEVLTENDVFFEFAVPTPSDISETVVIANPILLIASDHVLGNILWWEADEYQVYNPTTDPEALKILMRRVAVSFLSEDVDGDGSIDWQDIVAFNPLTDKNKSRLPWEKILDGIEMRRQGYKVYLFPSYARFYFPDPSTLSAYDLDDDGDWRNDFASIFQIAFWTDKNNYTVQDLVDGQGTRGGKVILPDGKTISYSYSYENEDGEEVSIDVENDQTPPLSAGTDNYDDPLWALVGGDISDPDEAPVGEYTVQYSTGDGLFHEDDIYLYENSAITFFYVIPSIDVDEDGFIEKITYRFEDVDGNTLQDPPILYGNIRVTLWDSVETVNDLVRGENYYTSLYGLYINDQEEIFSENINLADPEVSFIPENNGHKIYFEDTQFIGIRFITGDGVMRHFYLVNNFVTSFYPALAEDPVIADGKVTVNYNPVDSQRPVVSILYRFDNTWWLEIDGDTLSVDIPDGATLLYVTAKDTSGFYRYPPDEIDLTE
jgi:hypothetical protein